MASVVVARHSIAWSSGTARNLAIPWEQLAALNGAAAMVAIDSDRAAFLLAHIVLHLPCSVGMAKPTPLDQQKLLLTAECELFSHNTIYDGVFKQQHFEIFDVSAIGQVLLLILEGAAF